MRAAGTWCPGDAAGIKCSGFTATAARTDERLARCIFRMSITGVDLMSTQAAVAAKGQEHWTKKGDVKLFMWEKQSTVKPVRGTILFVQLLPACSSNPLP